MKEKRGLQNIVTLRLWQKGEGIPPDQVVNLAVERGDTGLGAAGKRAGPTAFHCGTLGAALFAPGP